MPNVEVRTLRDSRSREDWLSVPGRLYHADPNYIEPLRLSERERISARHNPFFSDGEAEFFIAYMNGSPVGRMSAQINRVHLAQHADATGQFGFFDCADDTAVAEALVDRASQWLSSRGIRRVCGPFNLTINQDSGLLVDGFSSPPAILTSHAGPWTGGLLEHCGFTKAIDLFAYRMRPQASPRELTRLANFARQSGRIRVRNIDMSRFAAEARLIFDIFNDAWSDNWGFVPVRQNDIDAIVRDMRPIMRKKFGFIAEIDGVPAAMLIVLPDVNRTIAPFNGRLLPFNWARLAQAVLSDKWKTARIPLLGIRKCHRNSPLGAGILSLLISDALELARSYDLEWVEFSWVLETNRAMVNLGTLSAGAPAKVFRVYEKHLADSPGGIQSQT